MKKITKICPFCDSINRINSGEDIFFIKELKSGYVLLCHQQFYKGYLLFAYKEHKDELSELTMMEREIYLLEMSLVAEAIKNVFKPKKVNYELLGNTASHLHWHLIPRYKNDPNIKEPIWIIDEKIRKSEKYKPTLKEIRNIKTRLVKEINFLLSKNNIKSN